VTALDSRSYRLLMVTFMAATVLVSVAHLIMR
jgi:hypothetical protein